jgi:protoheme IX farnesyltransferase
LASQGHVDFWLYVTMLVGLCLIIASGCVWNNYIDRGIDEKMARTKNRALVSGEIPVSNALIFGTVLGVIGTVILLAYTNILTAVLAVFGFVAYVIIYGIGKRRTVHGTVIGSVSGAIPPVVGYCAVTNGLDLGALVLFLIIVFWQMPHFYAIAMYRLKDYKAAGIPVLPAVSGLLTTKIQIISYIVAFTLAAASLTLFGYTGYLYLVVAVGLGLWWLKLGIIGFETEDDNRWARKMFGFSLVVVSLLSVAISIDSFVKF